MDLKSYVHLIANYGPRNTAPQMTVEACHPVRLLRLVSNVFAFRK